MKHLYSFKLFESVVDDFTEKWIKIKADYDKAVSEIKNKYLKSVSDCIYDLTDYYDLEYEDVEFNSNNIENTSAIFKFNIPLEKKDNFFQTLEGLNELVRSHISEKKKIYVVSITTYDDYDDNAISWNSFGKRDNFKEWLDGTIERDKKRGVNVTSLLITIKI